MTETVERRQEQGMSWMEEDEEMGDDSLISHTRTEREREKKERKKERERERTSLGGEGVTLGHQNPVT